MINWLFDKVFKVVDFFDSRSEYEKKEEMKMIDSIQEASKEYWFLVSERGGIRKIKKEPFHYDYELNESSGIIDKVLMFFDKRTPYERWEEMDTLNKFSELRKSNHVRISKRGGLSITPKKELDHRKKLQEASKRAS